MGGGMGHTNRLLAVATRLAAAGHVPIFALRETSHAEPVRRALPGTLVVQAPRCLKDLETLRREQVFFASYADVLFRGGYDSAARLEPLVATWRRLFEAAKPNLIVCDHSPTVVLAASGDIPVVHVGSGFATPPAGRPFLPLGPRMDAEAPKREADVLAAIRTVQERRGAVIPTSVPDVFGLGQNFACCLPELDPYRTVRPQPALGPMEMLPASEPWPEQGPLFAYLNGRDPRTAGILIALARDRIHGVGYVRDCPKTLPAQLANTSFRLFAEPPRLVEVLKTAVAVLHHGGLATTETAFAMGRLQILLPAHLEQLLTAKALEQMGCGAILNAPLERAARVIEQTLARSSYRIRTQAEAARLAARGQPDALSTVLDACAKCLR